MGFVDPYTKQKLNQDDNGNLFCDNGEERRFYSNSDGSYDFTIENEEKAAYDHLYQDANVNILAMDKIKDSWHDARFPHFAILLNSMGDLTDKKVLLLGNGTSLKELYFLQLGAKVVYTDLSFQAVKSVKRGISCSELNRTWQSNIEFHAVDALHLPFENDSFDIIYGSSFVHHIEDKERFFSEVYRCLDKGGICRFLDDAHSPIWQFMKTKLLKPLLYWRIKRRFISPEDIRHTLRGGFRKEKIIYTMDEFGFKNLIFIRSNFFHRLFRRSIGLLFQFPPRAATLKKDIYKFLFWIDFFTGKIKFIKNSQIDLIWGFEK